MTLSQKILVDAPSNVTPSQGLSGWPCPPRLQEETWRIGGVLTGVLMYELNETFGKVSDACTLLTDTISSNIIVLGTEVFGWWLYRKQMLLAKS